jgi:uncharacterized protein YggE
MAISNRSEHHQSSFWPNWHSNPLFTVLFGVLLAYGIVLMGANIRQTLVATNYIGIAERQPATITVNGVGKSSVAPDLAVIDLSIRKTAPTSLEAQNAASEGADTLLAALRALGIAEGDMQTTSVNTYEQWDNSNPPKPYAYSSEYGLTIKVRDQAKTGAVLAAAATAGATNIYGPRFELENQSQISAEARQKAVDDARLQAEQIAQSMGARLGGVVSYSEWNGGYYPYGKGGMMDVAEAADPRVAPAPEIVVGQTEMTVNVTINYALY